MDNDRYIEQLLNLQKRVEALEAIIHGYGLAQEFQPLKLAAVALNQSEQKLRKMVHQARLNPRNNRIKVGVHYSFNGNRILINVRAWERDIKSIPPEKW